MSRRRTPERLRARALAARGDSRPLPLQPASAATMASAPTLVRSFTMAQALPVVALVMAAAFGAGCEGAEGRAAVDAVPEEGEAVEPPFEVRGEVEGLLLVWFDEEGLHTAQSRAEVPEARRAMVRVDDLGSPPSERLDPELVYVADLRRAGEDGSYPVRRMPRASFDRAVEEASAAAADVDSSGEPLAAAPDRVAGSPPGGPEPAGDDLGHGGGDPDADVVIYGASWCHACRSAAAFLRSRGVDFVERDVEREPGAREAMMSAARAAGVRPRGIPVIDFRGQIILGFDQGALERAIAESPTVL